MASEPGSEDQQKEHQFCLELLTLDELIPQVREHRKSCPQMIPLTKDTTLIGRANHPTAKVDFHIDFKGISGEHAKIIRTPCQPQRQHKEKSKDKMTDLPHRYNSNSNYRYTIIDLKPQQSGGMVICQNGYEKWAKKYRHELSINDKVSFGKFGKLAENSFATPKHLGRAEFSYRFKEYNGREIKKHGRDDHEMQKNTISPKRRKVGDIAAAHNNNNNSEELARLRRELDEIKKQSEENEKRAEVAERKEAITTNMFSEKLSEQKKRALEDQQKIEEEHQRKRKKIEEESEKKLHEKMEEIVRVNKEIAENRRESLQKDQLVELQKQQQEELKREMERQKEIEKKKSEEIEFLKMKNQDLQVRADQAKKKAEVVAEEALKREKAAMKLLEESKKRSEIEENKSKEERKILEISHQKESAKIKAQFEEEMKKRDSDKEIIENEYQKKIEKQKLLQKQQMKGMKERHKTELKRRQKEAKMLARNQEKAKIAKLIADQETLLVAQEEELACAICFEVMEEPRALKECRDTFCKGCIEDWLARHRTCPNCRESCTRASLKRNTIVESSIEKYLELKKLLEAQKVESECKTTAEDDEEDEDEVGDDEEEEGGGEDIKDDRMDFANPCTELRKNLLEKITGFLESKQSLLFLLSYLKDLLENTLNLLDSDISEIYLVFDCLKAISEEIMRHMNQMKSVPNGEAHFTEVMSLLITYWIKAVLHEVTPQDTKKNLISTSKSTFLQQQIFYGPVVQVAETGWSNVDLCNVLKGNKQAIQSFNAEYDIVSEVRVAILCSQKRWVECLNYAKAVKKPYLQSRVFVLSNRTNEALQIARTFAKDYKQICQFYSVFKEIPPQIAHDFLISRFESIILLQQEDLIKLIFLILSFLSSIDVVDITALSKTFCSKLTGIANYRTVLAEIDRLKLFNLLSEFGYHCLTRSFQHLEGEHANDLIDLIKKVMEDTHNYSAQQMKRLCDLMNRFYDKARLEVTVKIAEYFLELKYPELALSFANRLVSKKDYPDSAINKQSLSNLELVRYRSTKQLPFNAETSLRLRTFILNAFRLSLNSAHYGIIENELKESDKNAIRNDIERILRSIRIQNQTLHTYFVALKQNHFDIATQIVTSTLPLDIRRIKNQMIYLKALIEGICLIGNESQKLKLFQQLVPLLVEKLQVEYQSQIQNRVVLALTPELQQIITSIESSIPPIAVAKFYQQFCSQIFPSLTVAQYRYFTPYYQKVQHFYAQARRPNLYSNFCNSARRANSRQYNLFHKHYIRQNKSQASNSRAAQRRYS